MTRRDYILLSTAIRAAMAAPLSPSERAGASHVARSIANVLESRNGGFDPARFLEDCSVKQGPTRR